MIKLDTSSTVVKAQEHYSCIKFHLDSVLDLFVDALQILSDRKLAKNAKTRLYEGRTLESSAITGLLRGLAWDKKPKKVSIKKPHTLSVEEKMNQISISKIDVAFGDPNKVFNQFFITNAVEVRLACLFLKRNLKSIITGEPIELETIESTFKISFPSLLNGKGGYIEPFRKLLIMKIFNYGKFSSKDDSFYVNASKSDTYNRYDLVSKLDNRTCPYCNINPTYTVIKNTKGITSPSVDHFLDKGKHPIFALSFYNLIPGCTTCNSLKHSKEFSTKENIHPYLTSMENHAVFSYIPNSPEVAEGISQNFTIELNAISGGPFEKHVNANIETFKLTEIYNEYRDQVKDLIRLNHISGGDYLETLNNTYSGFSLSQDEIYRLAFGTYLDEIDFHKRPLSKMTKDILLELGMLSII